MWGNMNRNKLAAMNSIKGHSLQNRTYNIKTLKKLKVYKQNNTIIIIINYSKKIILKLTKNVLK